MNIQQLVNIGLTRSQAKSYLALVSNGKLTPPQLAEKIKESRTAAYMSLAKLEEIGLASADDNARTRTYAPANPAVLERLLVLKRQEIDEKEQEFRRNLPGLLADYYEHRKEPGIRFFQGEKGLTDIYRDHLKTKRTVHFVRTEADERYFGSVLYDYMEKRAEAGIRAIGLAPYSLGSFQYALQNDQKLRRHMTWFPREAYSSPVEISIYGDKASIISFGDEAIGMIIESPQIAEAFRELFKMAQKGAEALMKEKK